MTEVMPAQNGLSLTAPASRQDIVSALLNDYGSSFGSPYGELSPVPAQKELPLPPTPTKNDKPLPPVMTMKFQLRVDEPSSISAQRKNSIESPTRITSRSISRSGKPKSLKLTKSNGSTAVVPRSPAPPAPPKDESVSATRVPRTSEDRPLPPPPPEKSERRKSVRANQVSMGNGTSKVPRRDSKEPEKSYKSDEEKPIQQPQTSQVTKRKPVPTSINVQKFVSLADLQKGPRGRAVTPNTTTATVNSEPPAEDISRRQAASPREKSRGVSIPGFSEDETPRNALSSVRPTFSNTSIPSQLPTPPDDLSSKGLPVPGKAEAPARPPPRKVFVGLPSNPRAGGQETPTSGKHTRGKSSTGFDLFGKSPKPTSTMAPPTLNTTPRPTPSPQKIENVQTGAAQAPTLASTIQASLRQPQSPLTPESEDESRRPFSFEAVTQPPPRKQSLPQYQQQPQRREEQAPALPVKPVSTVPTPASADPHLPPRTTSREPRATPQEQIPPQPSARGDLPGSSLTEAEDADFVPLTRVPVSIAPRSITSKQLHCYTQHSVFSEFMNRFQFVTCMACGNAERGPKSSCSWCMLQLCKECRDELRMTPGRDLRRFLKTKGIHAEDLSHNGKDGMGEGAEVKDGMAMPSVVVWEADDDDATKDFS